MVNPGNVYSYGIRILIIQLCFISSYGQNGFAKNGSAVPTANCSDIIFAVSPNVVTHTAEAKGSAWYRKKLDLTKPFKLGMVIDLYRTIFTDGFTIALSEDTSSIGGLNNAMGWGGIKKSFAFTFDLKTDNIDNDPAFAHAAIQLNGNTNHNSSDNLAGPVNIEPYFNSPPELYQYTVFNWEPSTQTVSLWINNLMVFSKNFDIVNKIFNGNTSVYWGFTASFSQYTSMSDVPFDLRPLPGYLRAYFGSIVPRFETNPVLDTCYGKPIEFKDASLYESEGTFNSSQLARWYWEFGDGTFSALRNPLPHVYPRAGKYLVKYTVTNQIGCTIDTVIKLITLASVPIADFSIEGSCAGRPITFTDKSKAAVTNGLVFWQWDFNGEFASDQKDPVIRFTQPGDKTVYMRVSSAEGCSGDTTKIIRLGEVPGVDFSFQKDCDRNVQFEADFNSTVPLKKWHWDFGDNTTSGLLNPLHHFEVNGSYKAKLFAISTENCSSDTITYDVVINKIIPDAGKDTIAVKGQPVQLQATGADFYEWLPVTGLNKANISNPVAVLNQSQQYVVKFINSDGCSDSDTINIKIFDVPEIYVPTAFTPNGDNLNDKLHFAAPGFREVYYFKVFNRWGNQLFTTSSAAEGWDGRYNNHYQPAGVYTWVIKAVDYNGNVVARKGFVTLIR